ncbi:hypothetical protein [Phenylobacterium sp.]|uniref:hypothetical protein n=1 Tax=Phenylobacterium sp. TaxID=1871053 RepID=UPI00301CA352
MTAPSATSGVSRTLKHLFAALLSPLLALLLLAAPASAQLTREAQALRDFEALLDEAAKAPDFVGLAVAVVWDDQIQLLKT